MKTTKEAEAIARGLAEYVGTEASDYFEQIVNLAEGSLDDLKAGRVEIEVRFRLSKTDRGSHEAWRELVAGWLAKHTK